MHGWLVSRVAGSVQRSAVCGAVDRYHENSDRRIGRIGIATVGNSVQVPIRANSGSEKTRVENLCIDDKIALSHITDDMKRPREVGIIQEWRPINLIIRRGHCVRDRNLELGAVGGYDCEDRLRSRLARREQSDERAEGSTKTKGCEVFSLKLHS